MENPALFETQQPTQKSSRLLWRASALVIVVIVVAGAFTWYYLNRSCEVTAVEDASAFLLSQSKRYDDVYRVTADASRASVLVPVIVLQQISLDTQETDVPACMRTAKDELTNYMRTVIRAFQAYAAGEANATVIDLMHQSDMHYSNFRAELDEIRQCAPFCFRKIIY